jgi:hypothetical protein
VSNRGSLSISSPLAFTERLFFFVKYFDAKKGFAKYMQYYNKSRSLKNIKLIIGDKRNVSYMSRV